MATRKRKAPPTGPVSIRLLSAARVEALARGLATFLQEPLALDAERLDRAMAYPYDASSLGSAQGPGDCRAQAALLILGFRDQRPAGPLDPPTAFLAALALLDLNGFGPEDVPYAQIGEAFLNLGAGRALDGKEHGEAEALFAWLQECSRPLPDRQVPLPLAALKRLVERQGCRLEAGGEGVQVLRPSPESGARPWPLRLVTRSAWEPIHRLPDPGEGLVGAGAMRELRRACGWEGIPFYDDEAWQEGWMRHYRHLWPRLREAWA